MASQLNEERETLTLKDQAISDDAGAPAESAHEGGDDGEQSGGERDWEAEARVHGWTEKEGFKGDPDKWVDAETFVRRADEVMPFLKKQNAALKREMQDIKRDLKKASKFFSEAEQRAYDRAAKDLNARMDKAVEDGDVAASRAIRKELADLRPVETPKDETDPKQAEREFAEWVEANDWYVLDEKRREYADMQARLLGNAQEFEDGPQAYLEEIRKRVERKFEQKKPSAVNGGGNRQPAKTGGKSFNDLPSAAKAMCDKWVKNGVVESREAYVKAYDFGE